jgi:Kdo2-lipid IVA lauroyltransferase/acyltransferase
MGSKLIYYGILKPISYLPFFLLYLLSDFIFILVYHLSGYRKKVVYNNLKNSFPDKSKKEIIVLMKEFYRHFCDLVVESVKGFSISEKALAKRMKFVNPEVINEFYEAGKDVIVTAGHYNNWEWAAFATPLYVKHKAIGIYAPLTSKFFDNKMKSSRRKFGLTLCPAKETKAYLQKDFGQAKATYFIIDQTPSNVARCHWMDFLNQDTPVFFGAERYATMFDMPVLFVSIKKVKRGYYTGTYEVLYTDPKNTEKYDITETANRMVEQQILGDPKFWLWTHRRWKRKRPGLEKD